MKASEVRRLFTEIGYKASLRANPYRPDLKKIHVMDSNGMKIIGDYNVYRHSTIDAHPRAFALCRALRGKSLDSGERLI